MRRWGLMRAPANEPDYRCSFFLIFRVILRMVLSSLGVNGDGAGMSMKTQLQPRDQLIPGPMILNGPLEHSVCHPVLSSLFFLVTVTSWKPFPRLITYIPVLKFTPPYQADNIIITQNMHKINRNEKIMYLIYENITLKVYKRIFHLKCINL